MNNDADTFIHPSFAPDFDSICQDKELRKELPTILAAADAIQDATHNAVCENGPLTVELPMDALAIALCKGSDVPVAAAKLAGYKESSDGVWYYELEHGRQRLNISPSFFSDFLRDWADNL